MYALPLSKVREQCKGDRHSFRQGMLMNLVENDESS